eukprot:TRINITY_DN4344_c0_g1_i1.p1 TRINITY_DN4344_c0_g1~~TRINITY_DN4344_c0_g1_i1.p1  ORF type:complete len:706 (+),score=178.61 TRINITY_DN4344_c0_g1_i1:223-2118(+)
MCYPPGGEARTYSKRLPSILETLLSEFGGKLGMSNDGKTEVTNLKDSLNNLRVSTRSLKESSDSIGAGSEEDYNEYNDHEDYKVNEELVREMENVKLAYGDSSLTTREFPMLEVIDVELHLDISFLSHSVCSAWNIQQHIPLTMRMSFSSTSYRFAPPPIKVEVFQANLAPTGFMSQMIKILEQFVRDHWKDEAQYNQQQLKDVNYKKPTTHVTRDGDVASIIDMGFTMQQATNAVKLTKTLDEAIDLLMNHPEKVVGNLSDPEVIKGSLPTSVPKGEDPKKRIPSSRDGLLRQVLEYARIRIPTLPDFCVICDRLHLFSSGLLKPTVCSRELCCFAFQQLGVMADAAEDVATGAEVVDLLVSFAVAASKSARRDLIFDPFPTIVDPQNANNIILGQKQKDFSRLEKMLSKFPSVEQMTKAESMATMVANMDRAEPYSSSLLNWIISSNRSHLVKLNPDRHLKSMSTPFQYLLMSAPPEKDRKFNELKQQYGTIFAFHGSSVENWHSILRNGLKNASGTKLQVNGAAYGSGIYISPNASVSFGYCGASAYGSGSVNKDNKFLGGSSFFCLALCEVINKDIRKSSDIWVSPSEDFVLTRFFFAYPGGMTSVSAHTEQQQFQTEILNTLRYTQ